MYAKLFISFLTGNKLHLALFKEIWEGLREPIKEVDTPRKQQQWKPITKTKMTVQGKKLLEPMKAQAI